jgi:hypothetical protein
MLQIGSRNCSINMARNMSDETGEIWTTLDWTVELRNRNRAKTSSYRRLFFFLWLYSPIFGLSGLHKTISFVSVTRSRTVSRTPWTGDHLVAKPLLTAPADCDDGEVGGMNGFGRGNRSTRRKPAPTPLCPPQIPLVRPERELRLPGWKVSD